MANILDYTSIYTYEYILERVLSRVPDTMDKRQGSIIYNAVAPACQEMANVYVEMQGIVNQTFALTNEDEYQDLRYAEAGLVRFPATSSIRKGVFTDDADAPAHLDIGIRFSTITETDPVYYEVIAEYEEDDTPVPGAYQLRCETAGTLGNDYTGAIIPVDYIANLKTATLSDILVPGEDKESNTDFRVRYFIALNQKAFGGNIAQYREWVQDIEGTGPCQVYPVWNGGGTVKVSILNSDYDQASSTLIDIVQQALDPDNFEGEPVDQGQGLGTAPIGHVVTVVTPDKLEIDVSATLVLKVGYTLPSVEPLVEASLSNYLLNIRKTWGNSNDFNVYTSGVYIARTIATILNTEGVENVSDVLLNGSNQDIILTETKTTQQIPVLGTVTLS